MSSLSFAQVEKLAIHYLIKQNNLHKAVGSNHVPIPFVKGKGVE